MAYKRLRSAKTIESAKAADISLAVKTKVEEAIRFQNINLVKLPDSEAEIAEEIRNFGYYAMKACYDMNEYFSAVAGTYEIKGEKIELSGFVRRFYEFLNPFMMKKGFGILHKFSCEKIFIKADASRLYYVLANLLLNAAENSDIGTKIRISLSVTKKFAKITIKDSGFGMNEEILEHCCEPFFSTKKEKETGKMGLGLTLARHFAEESGGRFHVKSEEGKGTSVSILFPLLEKGNDQLYVNSVPENVFENKTEILKMVFSGIPDIE
ncbi:MAG: ATP-binding protein [Oscillospiraceae bacterium]|nr:ATP-binding protein [Oscillospiraceae bacterium]